MATRHQIVDTARSWLNTPWVHQGRLPPFALDCAGLLICVARQLKLVAVDFDVTGYRRQPDGTMIDICSQFMVPIDDFRLGAAIVVSIRGEPQHLGIIGDHSHGGWSIVHASNGCHPARVVETRLQFLSNFKFRACFDFPGVED